MAETSRAVSDRSDRTPTAEGLSSPSALPSQASDTAPDTAVPMDDATPLVGADVEPDSAPRARVRVGRDGTALVGRKRIQFGRLLAGALVTVEA